ncbi:MAG: 50S ribosomal protein L35ae [Candidatus Bathyarchaeia archaeon]
MAEGLKEARGVIVNYRVGPKAQNPKECILRFFHLRSKKEAAQLIGRRVVWYTKKKRKMIGKVVSTHGNKGWVRARFKRGLPGDALGNEVVLL